MAELRGVMRKIGDGRIVEVWICDANYPGCGIFGPIFRYADADTCHADAYRKNQFMEKLGWNTYLDGGSTICPNCSDRFRKEG